MSLTPNEKEPDKLLAKKREHEEEIENPGMADPNLNIKKDISSKSDTVEKEIASIPPLQEIPMKAISTCHICKNADININLPFSILTCTVPQCALSFCFPCTKKLLSPNKEAYRKLKKNTDERKKWVCFVCNGTCSCKSCCYANNRNMNIITIPNMSFCRQAEPEPQDIIKCGSTITEPIAPGNNDNGNCDMQINKRKCAGCNKSDVDLIVFKNIEEFLSYMKNAFEKKQGLIKNEPSFEQNRVCFFEVFPLLSKFGSVPLKETKFLCKLCLVSKSNECDGFKNLYKLLEIDSIQHQPTTLKTEELPPQNFTVLKEKEITDNVKLIKANLEPLPNQITPQKREDHFILNQMSDNQQDKGKPQDQCQQFENSLNFLLGNMGQGTMNKFNTKPFEIPPQAQAQAIPFEKLQASIMNNLPTPNISSNLTSNFSKIAESITNFNNQNLQNNLNVLSNVNQLAGILSNIITDPSFQNGNQENNVGENRKTGNEEEKKDDSINNNVTNIIMNFEQNKNHPLISYMASILDDLKKQINSIQYYSQMQKLFIAYIFKNLEVFMEQVSNHQLLNECQKSSLLGGFGLPMQMNQLNQIGQAMAGMNLPQQGMNQQENMNMGKKMSGDEGKQFQASQMELLRSTGASQGSKLNIQGTGKEMKMGQAQGQGQGQGQGQSMYQMNQMNQLSQMNMNNLLMEQLMKGKIGASSPNSQVLPQNVNMNPYLLGMMSNQNSMNTMNNPMSNPLLLAMQGNPNLAGLLGNMGGMVGIPNILPQQLGMPNPGQNYMQQAGKLSNPQQPTNPFANMNMNMYSTQNQAPAPQKQNMQMPNLGNMFMPGSNSNAHNTNSFNLMNLLSTQQSEAPADKIKPMGGNNEQQPQGEYMMLGNIGNLSNLSQEQLMQLQMYLLHGGNNTQNKGKDQENANTKNEH